MQNHYIRPDFLFETSWEVCNKVGGIYTVLSSIAKTLTQEFSDNVCFIGPDVFRDTENQYFVEDKHLLPKWRKAAKDAGLDVRMGRWQVPGSPVSALIDFRPFLSQKDEIYSQAWELFGVDSLRAYGDYDEASMFSYAAGLFVQAVCEKCLPKKAKAVYQAHEWMSGLGMLFLKHRCPKQVATVFTTHATSMGRSITSNGKNLYEFFEGYNGDQMAGELNMEAKHSIEKVSAHRADCFTTVSTFTDRECRQLLEKPADVVLPNGFERGFVPNGAIYNNKRKRARKLIFYVAQKLMGAPFAEKALIVSTSGRNDFRCKGFDVFMESMAQLNERLRQQGRPEGSVLALIEVPCWTKQPRQDLLDRFHSTENHITPLPEPYITHELHNFDDERIVQTIKRVGMVNEAGSPVKLMLIPSYLEGNDGVFDLSYYDMLVANDLCIYPSYYEPWGYTPLESCAFHIPCITTDLSGFGQWVDATLGRSATIFDGVSVLHRDDNNFFDVACAIASDVEACMNMNAKQVAEISAKASEMARRAEWKNFAPNYFKAFEFAMRKANLIK
ncbi:MAG: glycogen/starch synthase [Bacteroidaceae bacterium]|nr:glycogen/starch synthase [Bacteroidaceae bacterium]